MFCSKFWVFRKMNIFVGMKICGYFLGVIINLRKFRGHFYAIYSLFLRSMYRMGNILGLLKFQIFSGCLKFLIYFGGEQ